MTSSLFPAVLRAQQQIAFIDNIHNGKSICVMLLIIKTQKFTSTFAKKNLFFIIVVDSRSPSSIYFCIFSQHCIVIAIDFVSAHSTFVTIIASSGLGERMEKLNEALLLFNLTAVEKIHPLSRVRNAVVGFNAVFLLSNRHRRKPRLLFDREIFFD